MPFKKGNTLWKKGLAVKQKKQDKIDLFILTLSGDGMDRYAEIMDKLADGKEATKAENQYMDRLEGWRPYAKPKYSRVEATLTATIEVEGVKPTQKERLSKIWENLQTSK